MLGLSKILYNFHQRLFKTVYYTHGLVWFCVCVSDILLKLSILLHAIV